MKGMTPEELSEIRERLETAYHHEPFGMASAIADVRNLLGQVETLRDYLREKNEIIRAYAGPTGMTPEDVAYIVGAWKADGLGDSPNSP